MRRLLLCFALVGAAPALGATLYSNGSITTNPAAGAGGFDISQASADFDTLGFSVTSPARLADNFIANSSWSIDSVTVSGYITGSYPVPPSSSPISAASLTIWNAPPEIPNSLPLATSSSIQSNAFSGTYRVSNGAANFPNADRPVFELTLAFNPPVNIVPGQFWIDYTLAGGTVFSPMVMNTGPGGVPVTFAGNAMRKLSPSGSWVTLFGGLSGQGLDFPFRIEGTIIPEPALALPACFILAWRRR